MDVKLLKYKMKKVSTMSRKAPLQTPNISHVPYKGNIKASQVLGWTLLVVLAAATVGLVIAQLLVNNRQNELIEDTAARVDVQGQGRARIIDEWIQGVNRNMDAVAAAQLVRLYMAEIQGKLGEFGGNKGISGDSNGQKADPDGNRGDPEGSDAELGAALRAQTPYMQQFLKEFVGRNGMRNAHLLGMDGRVIIAQGPIPEVVASDRASFDKVKAEGVGLIRPLRSDNEGVLMDVLRPIKAMTAGDDGNAPVIGVLWATMPVGPKLAALVAASPVDRAGERTALVQPDNATDDAKVVVVGQNSLAPSGFTLKELKEDLDSGRALSLSVVDGYATLATLVPVAGTPLLVLQEYRAREALALMELFKPGIYTIVALAVVVLGALMMAVTVHLLAQRNRTRVQLLGQTMDAMVRAVEARDPFLAGHHAKVSKLVIKVGNAMNLPVGERATLFYAANLSAVGRLLIPRDMLAKKGKLTSAERKELEAHIQRAQDVLGGLNFDLPIVPIIQQMYEREDGSGYPNGLKGDAIHRMAKILAACDAYVALTSDRSFRKAIKTDAAVAMMRGGKQFWRDAVDAVDAVEGK